MSAVCHRFIFTIQPPARQRALIGVHRDAIEGVQGVVDNECIHLTLTITNDFERYPRQLESELIAIGADVAAGPIDMILDRLSGSARSVALRPSRRIGGLSDLHRQLDHGLTRRRLRRRDWSFSPHTTLVYRKGRPFQQPVTPIEWAATDFVLIHSAVGETRHTELARWPLIQRQGAFDF